MLPGTRAISVVFAAAALALLWPVRSFAQGGAPVAYGTAPGAAPGARTHDGGYVRLQLGFNWTGVAASAAGSRVDYDGWGGSVAAAIGLSATDHLILYMEALDAGAWDGSIDGRGGRPDVGTDVIGIGPGATYYFGPNLFVAATLLLARAKLTNSNGDVLEASSQGFALELLAGKEWWVSANWGLGVSGQLVAGRMGGRDTDTNLNAVPRWRTTSLSLLMSATYN
jgi:hypothetical protein